MIALIKFKDGVDELRSQVQDLHKTVDTMIAHRNSSMPIGLKATAVKAEATAHALRDVAGRYHPEVAEHIDAAASDLEHVARQGLGLTSRDDLSIKHIAKHMLAGARSAAQSLGRAVAAKRKLLLTDPT